MTGRAKILFVFFSCLLVAACAGGLPGNVKPPIVTISNIVPAQMTLFEQRYDMSLRVQNPNDAALPVSGMEYAVLLNGQEFARGVDNQNVSIPALGEEIIHVSVTSTPLDWINLFNRINSEPLGGLDYKVSGTLHLESYNHKTLPFAQAGKISMGGK